MHAHLAPVRLGAEPVLVQPDVAREPAAREGSAAGLAARRELEELVDSCVAELGEAHREVILLRDYAGADWAFVAAELGSPSVSAAQQLHRRARTKLAKRVARFL